MKGQSVVDTIKEIFRIITENSVDIKKWIIDITEGKIPPIYSSHDIRNSGYKVSAVDANAFPAGFNNLCENSLTISSKALKEYIATYYPDAKKILLILEEHTRNPFYMENAYTLKQIIKNAGFETLCATLSDTYREAETASNKILQLHPLSVESSKVRVDDFIPDLIISNNDFSAGKPEKLLNIAQPVIPPPEMGWYRRRKSEHFKIYCNLAEDFGKKYSVDPWLISGFYDYQDEINFRKKIGFEEAGKKIDSLINKIQKKYKEYGINDKPFVFIKNNSGTYGMAVMIADSGESFVSMNRATQNKMSIGKSKITVSSVIIQEGIPTTDMLDGKVAEPLFYFIGNKPVGGFFRFHSERDKTQSLNVRGMSFAYDSLCPEETGFFSVSGKSNVTIEKIKVYEFAGILSTAAQTIELLNIQNERKK
ncbi:MAG: glutamate--cysteine ligase [Candidatus Schekmanbacteria bacterium]|nr:MAG: glutamate--cysteine ligase [Candidatus Schekmanbacteria bacterium]